MTTLNISEALPPLPPPPPLFRSSLNVNEELKAGQRLRSPDRRFDLVMQTDGNLVLYRNSDSKSLWATGTTGGSRAIMQGDGNFVRYASSGVPVWASNTAGNNGATVQLQNDANLVIYKAGTPIWASRTTDLIAGSPVRTVRYENHDGVTLFSESNFFSSQNLCSLISKVPLAQLIRSNVEQEVNKSPLKMRSDSSATISNNCKASAQLLSAGSPNIRILIELPQNSFSLFLTTPDIGPIGLPGSVDPHADFNFDLQVHTNIIVPLASGQQLSATNSGGSSSNMRIVHENATASAVTVFNDVIKFFGGSGFLNGLTDNHNSR